MRSPEQGENLSYSLRGVAYLRAHESKVKPSSLHSLCNDSTFLKFMDSHVLPELRTGLGARSKAQEAKMQLPVTKEILTHYDISQRAFLFKCRLLWFCLTRLCVRSKNSRQFLILLEVRSWPASSAHAVWGVIRVKIKCTNFFQFEFRNKSFCVQLLSNCSSCCMLNSEWSLS